MKNSVLKKAIIGVCLALFAAMVCLFPACETTESWVRTLIERYYYRFDGDYSSLEDLGGLSVDEMVAKLDSYSRYYTPEEYAGVLSGNAGNKTGIGVTYSNNEGGGTLIRSVYPGSPAFRAGLKAGDVAVSAEYEGRVNKISDKTDFTNFLSTCPDGSEFTLNLSDGGSLKLTEEQYVAGYAQMFTNQKSYSFDYSGGSRSRVEGEGEPSLPDGTAYIYISQFYGGAAAETAELISLFGAGGYTSLVLDLRGNGGGYVDVMLDIGGLFVSAETAERPVGMRTKFKDGSEVVRYCTRNLGVTLPAGTDVYVLADSNTASASEALIGVLVSYGVVGYEDIFLSDRGDGLVRSYGKGIMQSTFNTERGALKLTVAGVYWQNGVTIHGTGLTPDMGCSVAPAPDIVVNVGCDGELDAVIEKINASSAA